MGRKPRFEYPGGIYHLIQRGNNREFIFERKEDKEYLLDLIKEYREIMGFNQNIHQVQEHVQNFSQEGMR